MPAIGPARAGAHIGGGARDRAGDADAAEERRGDIGEALRHQLAVRAVPPSGHAVGDDGREQRFDRAEQREGEGIGQHGLQPCRATKAGSDGTGRAAGMPPKRVPMVSTGRLRAISRDGGRATTAMSMPGQCGRQRLRPTIDGDGRRARRPTRRQVDGRQRRRRAPAAWERGRPAPCRASVRPRRSLIWLAKMITAMPAVKPTVTGIGNELDVGAEPQKADRRPASGRPCMVASIRPSMPCCARRSAATSTMKAPAGPPIWKRLPPRAETRKPPTIAV